MKRLLLSISLMLLACNGFAQKGFGADGTIGVGQNGGDMVYPLLLEGRVQFNDYFSMNLGIGAWNSGFKGSEKKSNETTLTYYNFSSNKTLPSLQWSVRGQVPVFRYNEKNVRLFIEPKIYFLPFSAQTVSLTETYYDIKTDAISGQITYSKTGQIKNSDMKSESISRVYGGVQVGLAYELFENVDLAISYGYTNMDLFKDMRGRSITDQTSGKWALDTFLPRKDLQQLNISFLVNFNLN